MSTLDIRLFGAIEIRRQDALLTDFRSQKTLALLAYLICQDRPVTREHLAGLAWPEMEQSQALGLLRCTLHDLTSKLPDCLVVDRRTVHFQPLTPVVIDVCAFAKLATQDDPLAWAQAVDLYRTPLLEGVYLDEAPDLESWLLREQEQWQQQMLALLDRLLTHHTATAAYHDALRYARRLVALEPWREETHCQVMLLLARAGQISAALAHYGVCRRALWAELAVEPGPHTQALYARLQAAAQRPLHNLPPTGAPLIGRNMEVCDALLLKSLATFRQFGEERGIAAVLQRLVMQMMDGAQDPMRAQQFAQESLAIARRLDARGIMAGTLILLGELATRWGDLQEAECYLTESLALDERRTEMRAWALGKLGRVLLLNGKPQAAERIFQEALQIRQEMGSIIGVAWMLECLGEVAVATGAHEQAVPLCSIAHTLRARQNAPLPPHEQQIFDHLLQQTHASLGEERFTTAWRKGQRPAQEQTNFAALFAPLPSPV